MHYGHLIRSRNTKKNNMPRKNPLLEDYAHRVGSERSNNNRIIIAAVVFMVLICGAIFFLTEAMRVEAVAPTPVDESNRGCIASAYQATQNGFDLEANLQVCD